MTDTKLKLILDELFFSFEENGFEDNGTWPRKINLIFSFSDYIKSLSDEDISEILKTNKSDDIQKFRRTAQDGIDNWLNENMKTLMF